VVILLVTTALCSTNWIHDYHIEYEHNRINTLDKPVDFTVFVRYLLSFCALSWTVCTEASKAGLRQPEF